MKKCTKMKHLFRSNNKKCVCGKADAWWFECNICKIYNICKHQGIPCDVCLNSKGYQKKLKEEQESRKPSNIYHKKYRDAVAFGYDKATGRPLAVDKRGRKFDPGDTRYTKHQNDPHGWKATDKVPPKRTYHI